MDTDKFPYGVKLLAGGALAFYLWLFYIQARSAFDFTEAGKVKSMVYSLQNYKIPAEFSSEGISYSFNCVDLPPPTEEFPPVFHSKSLSLTYSDSLGKQVIIKDRCADGLGQFYYFLSGRDRIRIDSIEVDYSDLNKDLKQKIDRIYDQGLFLAKKIFPPKIKAITDSLEQKNEEERAKKREFENQKRVRDMNELEKKLEEL